MAHVANPFKAVVFLEIHHQKRYKSGEVSQGTKTFVAQGQLVRLESSLPCVHRDCGANVFFFNFAFFVFML